MELEASEESKPDSNVGSPDRGDVGKALGILDGHPPLFSRILSLRMMRYSLSNRSHTHLSRKGACAFYNYSEQFALVMGLGLVYLNMLACIFPFN